MAESDTRRKKPLRDAGTLLVAGLALGLLYNFIGLKSQPAWGLDWIAEERTFADLPAVALDGSAPAPAAVSDDPLAIPAAAVGANLPPIPDVGRPVEIELGALKAWFDAGAAVVVDAREAWEYEEGHIPGAISLPFDEVITDPVRLEAFDSGGKPVITYCGGGSCELSLSLAYELAGYGHGPTAVYTGGFPEWEEAGYAVERGAAEASAP